MVLHGVFTVVFAAVSYFAPALSSSSNEAFLQALFRYDYIAPVTSMASALNRRVVCIQRASCFTETILLLSVFLEQRTHISAMSYCSKVQFL